MYGTIAKLRIKPGKEDELMRISDEEAALLPDMAFQYVYRTDADPLNLMLIVGFATREAYWDNARSPEQHERYLRYRALLDAEPEWHDGEIIYTHTASSTVAGDR